MTARTYLDAHEAERPARRSPWGRASAARCRGLLAAAEGDPRRPSPPSTAPSRNSRALVPARTRAHAALPRDSAAPGAAEAAAREALDEALAIFEGLGAPPLAEKARAELARISGRSPA